MILKTSFHCLMAVTFLALSACTTPAPKAAVAEPAPAAAAEAPKTKNPYYLICKAQKSHFQFDWSAASPNRNLDLIDQNSVRYEFRAADHPAGDKGQNLKVGECSWASVPLAATKKEKSQFIFRSLSEEQTQAFYKMHTGKVFRLPVRQGKNGMEVLPGADVTILR